MDTRIITLQEQLDAKKLESFRLKKEQKKIRLENLKAKEQDLLKQIQIYDKKIEESKKSLMVEIKRKSVNVSKSLITFDSSSSNSSCSVHQNIINYDHTSQHMNESDRITWTDGKKYFYPIETKEANDNVTSLDKPVNEVQQKNVNKSKENRNKYISYCDSVKIDSYKLIEQSIETTPVCKIVQLHKETEKEINASNKTCEIETEVNIHSKLPQQNTLDIHKSNDHIPNLKEETHLCKKNEMKCLHLGIPLSNNSITNQTMSETSNNQESYIEIENEKSLILHGNINCSNTSSSNSDIQTKSFVNLNENDVCEKQKKDINQYNVNNYKIELDDIYSPDFTSDEYTSEFQESCQLNKNDNIELNDSEQSNETSYEEERSEGDIMFEDKTFIEQYSDDHSDFVSKIPY